MNKIERFEDLGCIFQLSKNVLPCHSESFACCHSERSEESLSLAQDKLREESLSVRIIGEIPR